MSQRKPTPAQIDAFAEGIVLHGMTQTDAWRNAFPRSKSGAESTYRLASKFGRLLDVRLRIDQLHAANREQFQTRFGASVEWKQAKLMAVVEAGLSPRPDGVPVNLGAVVAAVRELNLMAGDHAPTKNELTGKNGAPMQADHQWTVTIVDCR